MTSRINPTHKATITRLSVSNDDYQTDPSDDSEETVIEGTPVRYWARGQLERLPSGEVVQMSPNVTGAAKLSRIVREGDIISLEPITEEYSSYHGLEIDTIREVYGIGTIPQKTRLELSDT